MRILTDKEMTVLYKEAKKTNHYSLVLMLAECGLPPGVLLQIRCRNIDLEARKIRTGKNIFADIPEYLTTPLMQQIHGRQPEDYVYSCVKDYKTPMKPAAVHRIVRSVGKAAGIRGLTPSILRTSFLVRNIQRGVDTGLLANQACIRSAKGMSRYIKLARCGQAGLFEYPNPRIPDTA